MDMWLSWLLRSRILAPLDNLMSSINSIVAPLYAQITAIMNQSRTLAAPRDTLLPKLLSGELRVNDALHSLSPAV
jgi:type I restriction enzyme S subunit